jgi:hypothetical protein
MRPGHESRVLAEVAEVVAAAIVAAAEVVGPAAAEAVEAVLRAAAEVVATTAGVIDLTTRTQTSPKNNISNDTSGLHLWRPLVYVSWCGIMSPASPVRDARPTPFGAGVRPRAARVSDPAVRVTEGLSALSNSSLARFDVAALGSCPQCARQIGPYVFESHGLFRPFRARRKVVDAVPQGVALGWFVAAPFGAAGKRRNIKRLQRRCRCDPSWLGDTTGHHGS